MITITDACHDSLARTAKFKFHLSQFIEQYDDPLTLGEMIKALQEKQNDLMYKQLEQEWAETEKEMKDLTEGDYERSRKQHYEAMNETMRKMHATTYGRHNE